MHDIRHTWLWLYMIMYVSFQLLSIINDYWFIHRIPVSFSGASTYNWLSRIMMLCCCLVIQGDNLCLYLLTLTRFSGKTLWGVPCGDFGQNWPRYNSTALYPHHACWLSRNVRIHGICMHSIEFPVSAGIICINMSRLSTISSLRLSCRCISLNYKCDVQLALCLLHWYDRAYQ